VGKRKSGNTWEWGRPYPLTLALCPLFADHSKLALHFVGANSLRERERTSGQSLVVWV
jgi:hypothetical protein